MSVSAADAGRSHAGQAVYSRPVLAMYDLLVLRLSNRLAWCCPWQRLLAHYDRHITANHLDAGVGTGFFLDRCHFAVPRPRLVLLDLNANSLAVAGRRLARYRPGIQRADVLAPLDLDVPAFDSIGLNYLLHCLPGTFHDKGEALRHLKPLLRSGGTMFGATLLYAGVARNWPARRLMALYNARGIFDNVHDDLDGLRTMLGSHLDAVTIDVAGCAALFSGRAR